MAYKKLSESEKQEILQRSHTGNETITGLAEQYGVSTSTIRRLLKGSEEPLAEAETPEVAPEIPCAPENGTALEDSDATPAAEIAAPPVKFVAEPATGEPAVAAPAVLDRRVRRRVSVPEATPVLETAPVATPPNGERSVENLEELEAPVPLNSMAAEVAAELKGLDTTNLDAEEDLDDDLDDLEDLDEDEDDFEGDGDDLVSATPHLKPGNLVDILPLSEASLPRTCYLVVDRLAELVARPLKDFGDLGQIPVEEVQSRTLPVFDNHRVAKRFANPRTQRVIKLPDSQVLQKTSPHLYAKGITRLLVNGQVYSL